MKNYNLNFKIILFFYFSIFLLYNPSISKTLDISASVYSIYDNKIEFYLGLTDGLKDGDELYIKRRGEIIGRCKLIQVFDYHSVAEIIFLEKNKRVKIGDMISHKKIKEDIGGRNTNKGVLTQNKSNEISGKVYIVVDTDVGINLGRLSGLKNDMKLSVYRDDKFIGKIKVTDLGEFYSLCKITEVQKDEKILRGDTVIYKEESKEEK